MSPSVPRPLIKDVIFHLIHCVKVFEKDERHALSADVILHSVLCIQPAMLQSLEAESIVWADYRLEQRLETIVQT